MSNGYLVAAQADIAVARDLGEGFELEVLETAALGGADAVAAKLANASNVGILLSTAGTRDAVFYALVQKLSMQLPRAQLIVIDAEAPAMFGFFPQSWPVMALDEAQRRSNELKRRRESPPLAPEAEEPRHAAPIEPPVQEQQQQQQQQQQQEQQEEASAPEAEAAPPASEEQPAPEPDEERARGVTIDSPQDEPAEHAAVRDDNDARASSGEAVPEPAAAPAQEVEPSESADAPAPMHMDAPSSDEEPAPAKAEAAPEATLPALPADEPPVEPPPAPQAAPAPVSASPSFETQTSYASATAARARGGADYEAGLRGGLGASLTADASAFAPKKLRRETPELVRVVIYQPHQLKEVLKAAKKIDPRSEAAPQGMRVGEVALGESVGVSLDVRGASCDGAIQRRVWNGEPIDFSFTVEAEAGVKQTVILARVFVGDAQVGVVGFTRPISGPAKKAASADRLKLKRHKRVFLSYSSHDRETVSAIATAYEAAGIAYFWDRSSLKSGEEWSPRLRKEIDHADLFHLCWSKAAAKSEWVEKEAEHALTRRKRSNGKHPDITVQMLDGPPWAAHPASLDSINFDDFVRAAIVGYARGEGGDAA